MKLLLNKQYLFTLGLLLSLFSSCNSDLSNTKTKEEKQQDLNSLLKRGKVVNHKNLLNGANSLALTNDEQAVKKQYNKETKTLSWVLYNTDKMPTIEQSKLEAFALDFINKNQDEFKINANSLEKTRISTTINNQIILSYHRVIDGTNLRDSFIDFVFYKSDPKNLKLREIHNRTSGSLKVSKSNTPKLSFADLLKATGIDNLELVESKVIYIKKEGTTEQEIVKATEFKALYKKTGEVFTMTVENDNQILIEAYSNRIFEKQHQLKASVYKVNYLGNNQYVDLPLSLVQVDGNVTNAATDTDGNILIDDNENQLTISLSSPRVRVVDANSGNNNAVSFTVDLTDDKTTIANNENESLAINAFVSTIRINQFVKQFIKESDTDLLNQAITVNINVAGSCNAFYDGNISLFSEGTQGNVTCANMASINDVLYHEWGHGLDNFTGRNGGGIDDGAFSEGIGDITAAYYVNSPNMASGFFLNQVNGIRNLDNNKVYPDDLVNEVHDDGEIIGGCFWDMRKALIARYGTERGSYKAGELFFNHLLQTDAYTESYQAVLRLDDDDGNPNTNSPNFCLINSAFAKHGLATLEQNCTDTPEDIALIDETLFIAVASTEKDGALNLLASGGREAARIQICLGERLECLLSDNEDLSFTRITQENDRSIFISETSFNAAEHTIATIIAKDSYDTVIGSRTIKYVIK